MLETQPSAENSNVLRNVLLVILGVYVIFSLYFSYQLNERINMLEAKQTAAEAQSVMAIETSLAKASLNNVDLRDPQKNYHKMSVADAQKLTPHWNWDAYFGAIGGPKLSEMNVAQPEFFKTMDGLLTSVPIELSAPETDDMTAAKSAAAMRPLRPVGSSSRIRKAWVKPAKSS